MVRPLPTSDYDRVLSKGRDTWLAGEWASIESDVKPKPFLSAHRCLTENATAFSASAPLKDSLPFVLSGSSLSTVKHLLIYLNHTSIWTFRAIASSGSVRGHILVIGTLVDNEDHAISRMLPLNPLPRRSCEPQSREGSASSHEPSACCLGCYQSFCVVFLLVFPHRQHDGRHFAGHR